MCIIIQAKLEHSIISCLINKVYGVSGGLMADDRVRAVYQILLESKTSDQCIAQDETAEYLCRSLGGTDTGNTNTSGSKIFRIAK